MRCEDTSHASPTLGGREDEAGLGPRPVQGPRSCSAQWVEASSSMRAAKAMSFSVRAPSEWVLRAKWTLL